MKAVDSTVTQNKAREKSGLAWGPDKSGDSFEGEIEILFGKKHPKC